MSTIFKNCFIYFWERDSVQAGRGREREREKENPKQALHCQRRAWGGAATHEPWDHDLSWNQELDIQQTEPDMGLKLMNCEIMTWAKVGCSTNWTTQVPQLPTVLRIKSKLFSLISVSSPVLFPASLSSVITLQLKSRLPVYIIRFQREESA